MAAGERWYQRLVRSISQLPASNRPATAPDSPSGAGFQIRALLMVAAAAVIGLVGIILYSGSAKEAPFALPVGTMLASAASLSGGLLGFVFAIPRLSDGKSDTSTFTANSNLVQVSDWLTKILVGVSLIQFRQILTEVENFVSYVRPAFGNTAAAGPFTITLLLYFSIGGFIVAYMATQIYARELFQGSDVAASDAAQVRHDQVALQLTADQLTGKPNVQPDQVKGAIAAASPAAQLRVFVAVQSHEMAQTAAADPTRKAIQSIAEALAEGSIRSSKPD